MTEEVDADANPAHDDPILNPDLDPTLRAATLMYRDIHGRLPLAVIYTKPQKCPECLDHLFLATIRTAWYPYLHTDYTLACPTCNKKYLYGLSMSRDNGLTLIIWDTNPKAAIASMEELQTPWCPFHNTPMTPTKIFGDQTNPEKNVVTYQWKCPQCLLTHHHTKERGYPHGGASPFTDREEAVIRERLKLLGYIE